MPAPTAPAGQHSHNTTLAFWVTSAYVQFGGVKNISGPKLKVGVSKATTLVSPSATMEKLPGLIDEGSFNADVIFAKALMTTLRSYLRLVVGVQIQAADGTTGSSGSQLTFSCFITALGSEFPEDDLIGMNCEFEITGPVVYTPAT